MGRNSFFINIVVSACLCLLSISFPGRVHAESTSVDITGYSDSGDYSTSSSVSDSASAGQEETADSSNIEEIETEISDTSDDRTTEETTESFGEIGTLDISPFSVTIGDYTMSINEWNSLSLDSFVNRWWRKYNSLALGYGQEINRLDNNFGNVWSRFTSTDQKISSVNSAVSSLRTDVTGANANLEKWINDVRSSVSSLRTDVTGSNANLEKWINEVRSSVSVLRTDVTGANAKLEGWINDVRKSVSSLRTDVTGADSKLESSIATLRKDVTNANGNLESWINETRASLASLRSDTTGADSRLEVLIANVRKDMTGADSNLESSLSILRKDATNADHNLQLQIDDLRNFDNFKSLSLVDMNDLVEIGKYKIEKVTGNAPPVYSTYLSVRVTTFSSGGKTGSVVQEVYREDNSNYYARRVRHANGTWSSWFQDVATGDINDLTSLINLVNSDFLNFKNEIETKVKLLDATDKGIQGQINSSNQLISNLQNGDRSLQNQINSINAKIDGLSWSDAGVIAAIIGLHDTWKSSDPGGTFSNADGDAVQIIKGQTARLIGFLATYFADLTKSIEFQFDWYFKDGGVLWTWWSREMATTTAYMNIGFEDLAGLLATISRQITNTNQNLTTIIGWLKLIYEKPGASINVPPQTIIQTPFDFARLQEMLENLEFGNIINEPGTNLWDVLKEAISSLGNLLGGAISELGETARAILDFLDGLLDDLIGLIVPEDTDFIREGFSGISDKFNVKFKVIIDLGSQVKSVFEPIPGDFLQAISFNFMGAEFAPDGSLLDLFVPKFRNAFAVFIWLSVAWYAYRKLTGQGDLINDN